MDFPIDNETKDDLRIAFSDDERAVQFVTWLSENNVHDSNILMSSDVGERISDSFPINSKYQSLVEEQSLETRTRDSETIPTMLLTDQEAYLELEFVESKHLVRVDDQEVYGELIAEFDRIFEQSEPLSVDVPAWNYLLEQLGEIVGEDTKEEYRRLIAASSDDQSLDEISVALIAAALSGALNYDLAKWGEEMNIASKATFSRRKKELESEEIIETEKVPVDVGRPRQRLKLNDRVGSFDLDIGVGSEEIGIEEHQATEAADSSMLTGETDDLSETDDSTTSQREKTDTEARSVDELITELDEELKRVISDGS